MSVRILVVDDDEHARTLLKRLLSPHGIVTVCSSHTQAVQAIEQDGPFGLVVSDLAMPEPGQGLHVLRAVQKDAPSTPVILVTAFGNIDGALDAIAQGAFDYIQKPFDIDALERLCLRAIEQKKLRDENAALKEKVESVAIVGKSPALVEVFKQVARAAPSDVPVLILGETGTGKEMVARSLHQRSKRHAEPFVAVDCGAIAEGVMESELFGHVKGAFTGAQVSRKGFFEEADGGTLFLDEIGHISPRIQSLLLRALQEGEIRRVGESTSMRVDVRVVAATNKDLSESARQGEFREDLLYRLDVVRLVLPPLRERREDIPALVSHFARKHARGPMQPSISAEAMRLLSEWSWPGNVRQLENIIARATALNSTGYLDVSDFDSLRPAPRGVEQGLVDDWPTMSELQVRYAQAAVAKTSGNKSEAARLLGIDRKTLYRLLGDELDENTPTSTRRKPSFTETL